MADADDATRRQLLNCENVQFSKIKHFRIFLDYLLIGMKNFLQTPFFQSKLPKLSMHNPNESYLITPITNLSLLHQT